MIPLLCVLAQQGTKEVVSKVVILISKIFGLLTLGMNQLLFIG
jgi:hypothetical protein